MATKTIDQLPSSSPLTGTEVLPIVQGNQTLKTTVQDIANLAGLSGTNFIYVAADGTDTANATALSAAYTTAKTMSPSATNRITIVAAPGYYNFGTSVFTMDTQYIDLVSLDGNRSIVFNAPLDLSFSEYGSINITANDVFVKGINVLTKQFKTANSLNLLKVENCAGIGDVSFGGTDASGTYINCIGGNSSFGGASSSTGTFINCTGGGYSFGGGNLFNISSGIYENCVGEGLSFGGGLVGCVASGTYKNCIGGANSFGSNGQISGIFSNCVGGPGSWVGGTNVLGKLYFSRMSVGGQTIPSTSQTGAIVAFITSVDDFIAQDPL
jgi:hypothetical protein